MAFLSSLDIPGSALTAQKKRMDVITENVSNRETTRTENGGPYRRKLVVFQEITGRDSSFAGRLNRAGKRYGVNGEEQNIDAGFGKPIIRLNRLEKKSGDGQPNAGVMVREVIEDQSDFIPVYDPSHPDANEEGYVMMPNVNQTVEMIDAMAASRSYSANIAMFEAVKSIAGMAVKLGRS